MKIYDAIIIGAGNGGLTAALTLSSKGKKVLVLEKHNVPGGFATSFKRGRFEFEASLHELCDYGTENNKGGLRKLFDTLGVSSKIDFVALDEAFHVVSIDNPKESYTFPVGKENFINKMEEYVPGSKKSMQDFFELAEELKDAMAYLSAAHGKPDTAVLKAKYSNFMKVAAYSTEKVLDALEMPKKAQNILTSYWVYLGSPAKDLSFVHYALMLLEYVIYSPVVPTTRSHGMSLALEERLYETGGEIWYNEEVTKLLLDGSNKVIGVKLEDGRELLANCVISNASPHSVYGSMVDYAKIPEKSIKLANVRQFGGRGFAVFLGLNKSAEELGINNYSYFLYHDLNSNKEFEKMKELNSDTMVVVCLNKVLPDCSPKGTCVLYITSIYFSDCFEKTVTEDNYFKLKETLASTFIDTFERTVNVKIRENIEEIEIATPVTYAHYTNAPQGDIYGYLAHGLDNLMPRLMTMYSETNLDGLFFCGGHSTRLSGYSSSYLSGNLAGSLALAKLDKNTSKSIKKGGEK